MFTIDFLLAVVVLAAVPFWMAAYGGHVAAESITDVRHRRYVRLKFWGIGLVGLFVAFAYQYRVTKSDESKRQATQLWQTSVTNQLTAMRGNPTYSKEQKQELGNLINLTSQGPKPSPFKAVNPGIKASNIKIYACGHDLKLNEDAGENQKGPFDCLVRVSVKGTIVKKSWLNMRGYGVSWDPLKITPQPRETATESSLEHSFDWSIEKPLSESTEPFLIDMRHLSGKDDGYTLRFTLTLESGESLGPWSLSIYQDNPRFRSQ